jgi:hypothetical protein
VLHAQVIQQNTQTPSDPYNAFKTHRHIISRLLQVITSIGNLKSGKSAGPDRVIGELLKHANDRVADFFVTLFNRIFETGTFPLEWSKSIIVPIHKKGDVDNPDNYRGVGLD